MSKPTENQTAARALLPPSEAARRIDKSESWLAKSRMTGEGPPFIKIGLNVKYDARDLNAWIDARKYSSVSEYETRGTSVA
jgi:hypothetical protein